MVKLPVITYSWKETCIMFTERNKINQLLELEETKQLVNAKIIKSNDLSGILHWNLGAFDKAKKEIESLFKISALQEIKDLLDARILKSECLIDTLRSWIGDFSRDFDKTYQMIVKLSKTPQNLEKIRRNKAYISGAMDGALTKKVNGVFNSRLPLSLTDCAATFLNRQDAGSAAQTHRKAKELADGEDIHKRSCSSTVR